MKKTLLALSLLASAQAIAQPEGRVFTIYNQAYSNLVAPTIVTTPGWDDFDAAVPLGFNFTLMGRTTDSVVFDGAFNLGADIAFDSLSKGPTNMITFATDFKDRGDITGNPPSTVGYKTETVNGKKIAKIQWRNIGLFGEEQVNNTLNDSLNFQVWLYEGSNDVEVHWGPFSIVSDFGDVFDQLMPAFGFVRNIDFDNQALDYVYYVSSTSPAKVDSLDLAGFMSASSVGFPNYPANGTVFKFSKPTNSVNGVQLNDYTKVYPTVVADVCHIELNLPKMEGRISLIDMSGRVVLTQKAAAGKNDLNMQALPAGMYTININNGTESVFYKITKQ